MGLNELPAELRYSIYTHWFSDRIFVPDQQPTNNEFWVKTYLSDAFTVCKSMSYDPWLTQAVLHNSTFHLETTEDLARLQIRFGDAALQRLTHISLGSNIAADNATIQRIPTLMPGLRHIRVTGSLLLMSRVWDLRLDKFEKHSWARYLACLCVFAPAGVPGMDSVLTEQVLNDKISLDVEFTFDDPDFGKRLMRFSTQDWTLRYELLGREVVVNQVLPVDLQAALDDAKPS